MARLMMWMHSTTWYLQGFNSQSHNLPPTRDVLKKHIRQANYLTTIRQGALAKDPVAVIPKGQGWKDSEGHRLATISSFSYTEVVINRYKATCQVKRMYWHVLTHANVMTSVKIEQTNLTAMGGHQRWCRVDMTFDSYFRKFNFIWSRLLYMC